MRGSSIRSECRPCALSVGPASVPCCSWPFPYSWQSSAFASVPPRRLPRRTCKAGCQPIVATRPVSLLPGIPGSARLSGHSRFGQMNMRSCCRTAAYTVNQPLPTPGRLKVRSPVSLTRLRASLFWPVIDRPASLVLALPYPQNGAMRKGFASSSGPRTAFRFPGAAPCDRLPSPWWSLAGFRPRTSRTGDALSATARAPSATGSRNPWMCWSSRLAIRCPRWSGACSPCGWRCVASGF